MAHGTQTRAKEKETASKTRAVKDRNEDVVQDFLDRFARAITAGDGRSIVSMWGVPGLVIGDNEVRAVTSLEEVEQFFSGAKEQYNARGITDTRADILGLEWVTDRIAIVDVRWPYLDDKGKEKGEEASTYALKRDEDGNLKFHVAILRGASTPD